MKGGDALVKELLNSNLMVVLVYLMSSIMNIPCHAIGSVRGMSHPA
jgi:hypothetical protein